LNLIGVRSCGWPVHDAAALQRVEADVVYLHAVVNNAHVRRFLYEPGVRRAAKRGAIRDLLAASVHPVRGGARAWVGIICGGLFGLFSFLPLALAVVGIIGAALDK
jgi:hypothetical protein